jgi:hypothetical protein
MAAGAAAGIDFSGYDQINFVAQQRSRLLLLGRKLRLSEPVLRCDLGTPWGQNTTTYAHEMGHSLGRPHSGWLYYAYDSPWDVMSARAGLNGSMCGSYDSDNSRVPSSPYCEEPSDGYIAPHEDFLGWIPPQNQVMVNDSSPPVPVTLEADALPLSSAIKMIKVCLPGFPCRGPAARYLTVEAASTGSAPTPSSTTRSPGRA